MGRIWNGQLVFGLVSIPVGLVPAVRSEEHIGFRLLHRKDLSPIRYRKFCSKENVAVPDDEVVHGFESSKGKWTAVEKEEIAGAAEATRPTGHAIEILQFVTLSSLDPASLEKPYFLEPLKGGAKAYSLLRATLLDSRRVGIVRFAFRARPHLAALIPGPRALTLVVLRPFEELGPPPAIEASKGGSGPAEVKMARLLIDTMSAEDWDPTAFPDTYRAELKKLLKRKGAGRAAGTGPAPPKGGEVIDLMEALKRSLSSRPGRGGGRVAMRPAAGAKS